MIFSFVGASPDVDNKPINRQNEYSTVQRVTKKTETCTGRFLSTVKHSIANSVSTNSGLSLEIGPTVYASMRDRRNMTRYPSEMLCTNTVCLPWE